MLQSFLLSVYGTVQSSGVLSTAWGSALFERAYHGYKRFLEAGDVGALRAFVTPGAVVIDVGANMGFFTRFFSRCVTRGGRVIAIEPEEANFQRLTRMLARSGFTEVVEPIQAVAANQSGTLKLRINPGHPADHRIAEEGVAVRSVALDELLAERQWPIVSLIKIDVQGAEALVLAGAKQTIERFRPALFLEIDDANLRQMKADAEGVLGWLGGYGYLVHQIIDGKISPPLRQDQCLNLCGAGKYADFLFVHPANRPASAPSKMDGRRTGPRTLLQPA